MNNTRPGSIDMFARSADSEDDFRRKSVRGAVHMAGIGVVESFARLVATVILARLLSPEEIGLVAVVMVLVGLLEYVKDLGLGVVTIQKKHITHSEVSSLFWINVLLGLFFALLLSVSSTLIAGFYGDSRLYFITIALSATLFLGGICVQLESLLSRQMKQGPLAAIRLMATLLSSALAIGLVLVDVGYWALVVREVARAVLYLCGVWWKAEWLPSFVLRIDEVASDLKLGASFTMSFLQTAITRQVDVILVGKFFGPAAAGLYRQAQGLIVAPIEQFTTPILSVAQPALSALQADADRYRGYYQRMVSFVAMVTIPVGAFIADNSKEFTLVVLGEKWIAAAPFVCAFAVAMALRPTIQTTTLLLVTLGRSSSLLALESAYTVVFVIFLAVSVQMSALAVAVAFVAATATLVPPRIYFSFRDSPVGARAMIIAIRMSVGCSLLMLLSLTLFQHLVHIDDPIPSLGADLVVGGVAYMLPWLLVPSSRDELVTGARHLWAAMRGNRPREPERGDA